MRYCEACGAEIPDGFDECQFCGAPVSCAEPYADEFLEGFAGATDEEIFDGEE